MGSPWLQGIQVGFIPSSGSSALLAPHPGGGTLPSPPPRYFITWLGSWAARGMVVIFPIRKKESRRQQVERVVCFSTAPTKTKHVSRKEKEFIRPSLKVAESAEFFQKSACKLPNCFYLSNDLIISTGRLLMRLSILRFLRDDVRK